MVFFNVNGGPFRIYEIVMKTLGVWPLDRNPRRSMTVFSIIILVQISMTVMSLIHPLQNCFSIDLRNYLKRNIAAAIGGVLWLINCRIYGRSLIPLIKTTITDWLTITVPKERDIIKRHDRTGLFYVYFYMGFLVATSSWRLKFIPIIDEFILMNKRETCEFSYNFIWFNLLIFIILISTIFNQLSTLINFTLFWSFAMHLSARFKILKNQIEDLLLLQVVEPLGRKELRRVVDVHNQLLDLSKNLENSFTVCVAIVIFELQIIFGLMTFQTLTDVNGIFAMEALYRNFGVISVTLFIYVYYYAGEYLSACSEEIGIVFTQCNWYNLSKKSIKDYSIIIARCQKPCALTAVKMYKLNFSNLRYVFNAMYSYVTCIAAVAKATQ